MRQHVGLFFYRSLLLTLLLVGCETDSDLFYDPSADELTIITRSQTERDRYPTLSRDARVLAWVRIAAGNPDTSSILRWIRPDEIDTIAVFTTRIGGIDLSDDGGELVTVSGTGPFTLRVWSREAQPTQISRELPNDYQEVTTPTYVDSVTVLFGALSPTGQGVHRWNPGDGSLLPICIRFPDGLTEWTGEYPSLDRAQSRLCFGARYESYERRIVVSSLATCDTIMTQAGRYPRLWSIVPEEMEGVLYIDNQSRIRGIRWSTGERFYIRSDAIQFDVSSDGRWLFTETTTSTLSLSDLRNLR